MTLLLLTLLAAPLDLSLRAESPAPPAYTTDRDHRLGTALRYTGAGIGLAGFVVTGIGIFSALADIGDSFGCGTWGLQRCKPQTWLERNAGGFFKGGLAVNGVGLAMGLYGIYLQRR